MGIGMTHKILEALKRTNLWKIYLAGSITIHCSRSRLAFQVQNRSYAIANAPAPEVKGYGPLSCVNDTWPLTDNLRIQAFIPFVLRRYLETISYPFL